MEFIAVIDALLAFAESHPGQSNSKRLTDEEVNELMRLDVAFGACCIKQDRKFPPLEYGVYTSNQLQWCRLVFHSKYEGGPYIYPTNNWFQAMRALREAMQSPGPIERVVNMSNFPPASKLRAAFNQLIYSDEVPSVEEVLSLGAELCKANLDEFIYEAIDGDTIARSSLRGMIYAATRLHFPSLTAEDIARLNDEGHVCSVLGEIAQHGRWLAVRSELVKFSKRVGAEIEARTPPEQPSSGNHRPGAASAPIKVEQSVGGMSDPFVCPGCCTRLSEHEQQLSSFVCPICHSWKYKSGILRVPVCGHVGTPPEIIWTHAPFWKPVDPRRHRAEAEHAEGTDAESQQERAESTEKRDADLRSVSLKAYQQYVWAVEQNAELNGATDRQVYDWLTEHLEEGEKLPIFSTWTRYVREARAATNTRKNNPRSGRHIGPSIVRHDEF
jgi:hypothetical protein